VLGLGEAADHPHNRERGLLVQGEKGLEPAPAPRLSRTPGIGGRPRPKVGEHTRAVLGEAGFAAAEIETLLASGAAGAA
jgi:alpha-methylacyl-CoA racemase